MRYLRHVSGDMQLALNSTSWVWCGLRLATVPCNILGGYGGLRLATVLIIY